MLPRMASPSAPPSSAPVSEMPEASPAFSGGALLTISSVVRLNTGANPRAMITEDPTTSGSPPRTPTWLRTTSPRPPMVRQAAITTPGRIRWMNRGATVEPITNPTAEGMDHIPAAKGDNPTTSWRYWATNRK